MASGTRSDGELAFAFARRHDVAAYEELVARWDQRTVAFLAKATRDFEAAQDLRQEVFLRLYRYGATYKPEYAFTTWFFRIVRNVLYTWQAKESKGLRLLSHDDEEPRIVDIRPTPRDSAEDSETADTVRKAIDALEPSERELLVLRFEAGLNYREIGEIQDTPETTIKSRVYKLLGQLRAELSDATESKRAQKR